MPLFLRVLGRGVEEVSAQLSRASNVEALTTMLRGACGEGEEIIQSVLRDWMRVRES